MIANNSSTFLLILENERLIIPIAPSAFHFSQSSKKRLSSYIGALVIDRNGNARVIKEINMLGFFGESLGRKLISMLFGAYEINVVFERISLDFNEFKNRVEEYISVDSQKEEPYLPQEKPLDRVLERIKKSQSFEELFNQLNIPAVEDCLDVL